ncbi:hypothetical protein JCM19275_3419 [Nonlabens ulvanivorans]|uniref:Molybdenum cofactor biosynthesis protein MoaD n=1 Tax=Nonlabens ulvanivorans TaxID=906888 RepID=A0A090WGR0_NONUL|nr:MoaD/ThiS family protein [Nonlabens ulvanivorans]GAL74564.1 hypothetical protein JCM19275_3419 [Nonlabens ulvanivorans]
METIEVHYFGEIAEKTAKTIEQIVIPQYNTAGLKDYLLETYGITTATIKIAINKQLVDKNTVFTQGDTIAVLSPFAGG